MSLINNIKTRFEHERHTRLNRLLKIYESCKNFESLRKQGTSRLRLGFKESLMIAKKIFDLQIKAGIIEKFRYIERVFRRTETCPDPGFGKRSLVNRFRLHSAVIEFDQFRM